MAAVVVSDAWPPNKVVPKDTDGSPAKSDLSYNSIVILSFPFHNF